MSEFNATASTPCTHSGHTAQITFRHIDVQIRFFLLSRTAKSRDKIASPRINFPIYPLFITSIIQRDSFAFRFFPHTQANETVHWQTTSIDWWGEVCISLFLSFRFLSFGPSIDGNSGYLREPNAILFGEWKVFNTHTDDHQRGARNELFAFQYTMNGMHTPVHTFIFIELPKILTPFAAHTHSDS